MPRNIQEVRRFLGLTSYYRKFIPGFAKVAQPLHKRTCKDTKFEWSSSCQSAFDNLKLKLSTAPALSYPTLDRDFTLDGCFCARVRSGSLPSTGGWEVSLHQSSPYMSREELRHNGLGDVGGCVGSLSLPSPLVWEQSDILADHAAVQAVLGSPNLSGKHARW